MHFSEWPDVLLLFPVCQHQRRPKRSPRFQVIHQLFHFGTPFFWSEQFCMTLEPGSELLTKVVALGTQNKTWWAIWISRCLLEYVFFLDSMRVLFSIIPSGNYGNLTKLWKVSRFKYSWGKSSINGSFFLGKVTPRALGNRSPCLLIGYPPVN